MDFIGLCQRVAMESGLKGVVPLTTSAQQGNLARIVTWVNDAWLEIQGEHQDWQWLRTSTSFPTVSGKATYTPTECNATDFGMWARDSFRNYVTTVGNRSEVFMFYTEYDHWRNLYQYGANRYTTSRPIDLTITPDKSIGLGPVPNSDYTVSGDYFKAPTLMVDDTDVPLLPAQWHMAIVYRAMMSYGAFNAAPEVYQRGELGFNRMMARVRRAQLPEISFAGPLC